MKLIPVTLMLLFGYSQARDTKCPSGEVPDANGICIQPKYIQGCHEYSSALSCGKCQYKYKLTDVGLCEYQKQTGQSCCVEKNNGKCVKCNIGLQINTDGTCKQNNIIGCLQKSQNGTDCINCASDYFLSNGKCETGIKECDKYLSQTSRDICSSCKKNYSLVNNACLKNKILGCEYQVSHRCDKCSDPFRKKEDHCEIPNCLVYNDFGCTACECGYYLTPKNTCSQVQPGCIRYQRGICNDCQTHFRLRGGACVMEGCSQLDFLTCNKCSDGYVLADGGCKLKNCSVWDNGNCYVCDKGFVTQQGKCIEDYKPETIKSS